MQTLQSSKSVIVSPLVVACSLLVAAVCGSGLATWLEAGPGTADGVPGRLLFVCAAFALTLLTHADHGEDVLNWMSRRYWFRLLVWITFAVAVANAGWGLLQLEFVGFLQSLTG